MSKIIKNNLVLDTATAAWMVERVHDDGLMANVSVGFPYVDGGVHVCAVRLDYAVDAEHEVSNLLAICSERSRRFLMKEITPPALTGDKKQMP